MRCYLALAAAMPTASNVLAGSRALFIEKVDPGSVLPDYVVNRVLVDFTDAATPPSLAGQQMVVMLRQGSIYNYPVEQGGTHKPPLDFLVNSFPVAAFDTFVAMCGESSGIPFAVLVQGGASGFPSFPPLLSPLFVNQEINAAWAPGNGVSVPPMSEPCLTAQVTLTENAQGTWWYLSSTADGTTRIYNNLRIENGMMLLVPEPTGAMLAFMALLSCGFARPLRSRTR